jgi:RNA polymerase sigma factor (sigma-70 family)
MSGQPAVALPADAPSNVKRERLAALFDAHEDRLYRLARRLAPSADETFLRAAKSLKAVPAGLAREEAWLVRVLVNIRRDHWRKTAVRRRSAATLRASVITYPSSLESALIAKRAVWGALDALPPRRRAIVVMHELEGMTLAAIASVLGLSGLTVRWHVSMGRRDLKRLLEPYTGDIA